MTCVLHRVKMLILTWPVWLQVSNGPGGASLKGCIPWTWKRPSVNMLPSSLGQSLFKMIWKGTINDEKVNPAVRGTSSDLTGASLKQSLLHQTGPELVSSDNPASEKSGTTFLSQNASRRSPHVWCLQPVLKGDRFATPWQTLFTFYWKEKMLSLDSLNLFTQHPDFLKPELYFKLLNVINREIQLEYVIHGDLGCTF